MSNLFPPPRNHRLSTNRFFENVAELFQFFVEEKKKREEKREKIGQNSASTFASLVNGVSLTEIDRIFYLELRLFVPFLLTWLIVSVELIQFKKVIFCVRNNCCSSMFVLFYFRWIINTGAQCRKKDWIEFCVACCASLALELFVCLFVCFLSFFFF